MSIDSTLISAILEDYLEVIYNLSLQHHVARVKDIAKSLRVAKSTVSGALHSLSKKKLINYSPYEMITLTTKGELHAKDVVRKHEVLRDFFSNILMVDPIEANKVACKMEHAITKPVFEKLVRYIDFINVCPRGGEKWIKGFSHYCDQQDNKENCVQCVSSCLEEVKCKLKKGRENMIVDFSTLKIGQKARINKIKGKGDFKKRIMEMGFLPGTLIEIEKVAPFGDPIDIKLKGYHLSLRKEESKNITVELLS